jgi:hypothetical protein
MTVNVTNNVAKSRFEAAVDGHTAVAEYRLHPGVVIFPHTVVPEVLEGQGVGSALVRAALEWARAEGLKVVPACSFFAGYMARHLETQDLLADGERDKLAARAG